MNSMRSFTAYMNGWIVTFSVNMLSQSTVISAHVEADGQDLRKDQQLHNSVRLFGVRVFQEAAGKVDVEA